MERSAKNRSVCKNEGTAGGASGVHTSVEGHGVAPSSGYDYEVFLSFRGPDTRAGFTDFLYTSLKDAGIRTFKDDEDLRKGKEFAPELLRAIKESKISIPIFSKDYASSVWCLKEVVQMVECKKTEGQKIIPIFYNVAPAEVRYQSGGYGEAFLLHESKERHDRKTITEWKDALTAVGAIHGWDLHSKTDRREGEFVKAFTQKVFNELKKAFLVVSDCLVGADNHVGKIMQMIGAWTGETRIVGIHGMGGIGKTTIAKLVYNQLSRNFDNRCFLSDVRETSQTQSIACLQKQLLSDILKMEGTNIRNSEEGTQTIRDRLSDKKVLLLLDDVDHKKHLDALVGNCDWFGEGSILIITTRNKEVLKLHGMENLYEVDPMDPEQSLQLFSRHAFRRGYPLDEYINQSKRAVKIAGGLPLALEIIGSLLAHTEKKKWDVKLGKLEDVPSEDVQTKLRISYDALDIQEKRIFVDVACLFIGYDKDIILYYWEPEFHSEDALDVLENMSLIKFEEDNKVWMHDQLKDLGRQEVLKESNWKIKKQSRVWNPEKGLELLKRHEGKTKVEALRLTLDHEGQDHFTYTNFKRLANLRFLEVNNLWTVTSAQEISSLPVRGDIDAEERLLRHEWASPTNDFQKNLNLLPQLRWLSWHEIPPAFNITNFSMDNVVILDLSQSKITDDWKGWSHLTVMRNLKVLDLTECKCLKRTPTFSPHSNLERLILTGCESLVEVDGSICQLKHLVFLDLSCCDHLQRLPNELGGGLASLEYLSLQYCRSLERLPETIGNLASLIVLNISSTMIKELPDSIGKSKNLKVLKMMPIHINKIPDTFWMMEKVEEIEIRIELYIGRRFHVNIGDEISKNQSLRILRLNNANIYALPRLPESLIKLELCYLYMDKFPDLSNLTNLKELYLSFISRDGGNGHMEDPIPGWIGNLTKLESLTLSSDFHETTPPTDLCLPPQLKSLHLWCRGLRRLPKLPSSLSSLLLHDCLSLCPMGDLSYLKNLSSLSISSAAIVEIQGLGRLEHLRELNLGFLPQVEILPDLSNLNELRSLKVCWCDNLFEIQGEFPRFLDSLEVSGCSSLQNLPDLSSLMGKKNVEIMHCEKLNVKAVLEYARKSPGDLKIKRFRQLQILPDLSNLRNSDELRHLRVKSCDRLVEIQGELPRFLEELVIKSCESLEKLPCLSSLMGLREVFISICGNLAQIQGELPQSLEKLKIYSCNSLRELPNMSSLMALREVSIDECGNLVEIHSLPQSLEVLTVRSCKSLQKLPHLWHSKGLRKVDLCRCANLVEIQGELPQSLEILMIYSCKSLRELPNMSSLMALCKVSIGECCNLAEIQGFPQSLEELSINSCKSLQKLPHVWRSIGLREVEICQCANLVEIQGELPQSLQILDIYKSLHELPNMSSLMALREVRIGGCDNLAQIELQQSLEKLNIYSCKSLQELPNMSSLMALRKVSIDECGNLVEIQGFPQSLEELRIHSCKSLQKLPHLGRSIGLREVVVRKCANLLEIEGELPQSLEKLNVDSCESLKELPNMSSLMALREISIDECGNLVEIQGFPQSLEELTICSCKSLQKLPHLWRSIGLRDIVVGECANLVEIEGELPQSLEKLNIDSCESLRELPNMSSLMALREVSIIGCGNLVEIQGFPQSLEELTIQSCKSLQTLPNLWRSVGLRVIVLGECANLVEIQGELPQSLETLNICSCESLRELPNMSSLMGLRNISIRKCGNLVEIKGELPQSLETLGIYSCESLRELPNMSNLMALREVSIREHHNLVEIQGFPQSLETLKMHSCKSLQKLPHLGRSIELQEVVIRECANLVKIEGILPQSLKTLKILSCESLQELPALSSLTWLQEVVICKCGNLVKIKGDLLRSLETLVILSCESLEELPALSSMMRLHKVEIRRCRKLDLKAIALLCSEKSIKFVGEDKESKGEDEGSESEYEGEDEE